LVFLKIDVEAQSCTERTIKLQKKYTFRNKTASSIASGGSRDGQLHEAATHGIKEKRGNKMMTKRSTQNAIRERYNQEILPLASETL
jgi:multimeric flavodoxin WrbA